MKSVIYGAYSTIVTEMCLHMAKAENSFVLVGRDKLKLESLAFDLRSRGAGDVTIYQVDLGIQKNTSALNDKIKQDHPDIDQIVLAHGVLPDQNEIESSFTNLLRLVEINYLSYVHIMTFWAEVFEQKQKGSMIIFSSVAADRMRKSNYIYGSLKGAVELFAQGLRARFSCTPIRIFIIKPGMVSTNMTKDMKKSILFSDPKFVALKILSSVDNNRQVIYVPSYWQLIMFVIRILPEKIFFKLKI